ncbi:MAG: hypothetical protein ACYSUI_23260, partial [Planctomycetota bacterium]
MTSDLPQGKWLVDRARDYGLSAGDSRSVGGTRLMFLWTQAAGRISPDLAEAHFGRYNLLSLLGRSDEALEALDKYCSLAPADEIHRLVLLGNRFERLQTAEQRIEFCKSQIADPAFPAPVTSELHRWLAETLRGTGETALAQKHARHAVDLYRFNFAAWELLFDLQGALLAPTDRVKRQLASIAADPSRSEERWALAQLLDALSLHDRAEEWYGHAWDGLQVTAADEG